ncbi:MAG: DUF2844 domain-containing protein [Steroidobacteraceae bacterium]
MIATVLLVPFTMPAHAHLGGTVATVDADRAVLGGDLRARTQTQYDVNEITSDAGTVREYVTHDGTVFAITWQGVRPPDLRQLFGDYFQRFHDAAAAAVQVRPGLQRDLQVRQSDFVVHSAGHLRAFHGSAYLPALLPSGLSVTELQ